ncbi:hypothetical protein BDW75DRAFT_225396 [Aspergillus navahoensis]
MRCFELHCINWYLALVGHEVDTELISPAIASPSCISTLLTLYRLFPPPFFFHLSCGRCLVVDGPRQPLYLRCIKPLSLNVLLNRSCYLCISMLWGFAKLLAELVDCIDCHCYRDWVSVRGAFIICQGFIGGSKEVLMNCKEFQEQVLVAQLLILEGLRAE